MIKYTIQLGLASILLLFSILASWYEGSMILDNPWEWKYSTPISHFLNGRVQNIDEISQIDYFFYAAKFKPTYPIIMIFSGLYFLILIGYLFMKRHINFLASYLFLLGIFQLALSYLANKSESTGAQVLENTWIIGALVCIVSSIGMYFRIIKYIRMN